MGSQTPPKLPTVNFSTENIKPGSSSWIAMCNDVRQAFEDYGCFVAVYDKIGHEVIPLYESMGISNAATLEETRSFTNLMWSAGNDLFCETLYSYSKLVSELEQVVKRMVFESYGVGKYYDSHIGSTTYLL
ncbi:deoxypodophyllotoxin synthase-like [Cornus florida]|uniref:deoxypodophyllotoxin synthase-like n=1 Tax=Cornus florida TaxID=4283 RepID=UPI00289B94EB|nr:deoxypodophyllotoxin synthase-like [Cornus florida]